MSSAIARVSGAQSFLVVRGPRPYSGIRVIQQLVRK